jgi:integrase
MRLARNIYKRKDGRFEARYVCEYDPDGKAVYRSLYAKSYAEVKERLAIVQAAPTTGVCEQTTLKGELSSYLVGAKNLVKPSTYAVYERYLAKHVAPFFGNLKLYLLTQEILQRFVDRQLELGLSVRTVKSILSFMKSGLKSKSNLFDVSLPKFKPEAVTVLSSAEQLRLELAARSSDAIDCIGVTLCLYTGIRIGELCGLMWSDIDFDRNRLHIRRTLQRIKNFGEGENKTALTELSPKSDSSAREIPLPAFLVELLNEHRTANGSGYVISRDGKPIEPRNMQDRFKKLLATAGVEQVNFHTTRHTFATRALENGFDVKTLSEILGHSSATITLNLYAHCVDEHKRKCMESLTAVRSCV